MTQLHGNMTPREALAMLYALRAAYIETSARHPQQCWDQDEAFRRATSRALRVLIPVVHGKPQPSNEFNQLCDLCHACYARHYQEIPGRWEAFFCDGCHAHLPLPKEAVVPCSLFPEATVSYPLL